MDKNQGRGGRETRPLLGIDLDDPTQVARFCLSLGYSADNTVNALVRRCRIDRLIAQRIVVETMPTTRRANG
jgi:hypothetical protein